MEMMKVFDCFYDMPEDIRKIYYELTRGNSNDVYLPYYVYDQGKYKGEIKEGDVIMTTYDGNPNTDENRLYYVKGDDPISDWLFEQGVKSGETVLIKHWW